MKVEFAELHAPLFHGGKNHGAKLFNKDGLELDYDKGERELKVVYKGQPTYLPSTSVHNYTPAIEKAQAAIVPAVHHDQDTRKIKSAQVSGPHDHVFQGEGSGKKRDK
jgi:hypothetical protein